MRASVYINQIIKQSKRQSDVNMKIANGIVDTAIQQIIPIANTKARPRHTMTAEYITVHNTANPGASKAKCRLCC